MSITLPAVSQAGSQTTSHSGEIDEWWDLEEIHNRKGGGGGAAMTQIIDATSKLDLKIVWRKKERWKVKEQRGGVKKGSEKAGCYKDIIMNGYERGASERDPVSYGRGRESKMVERKREARQTG